MRPLPFVVSSEMCDLEGMARRPHAVAHIVHTEFLTPHGLLALAAHAYAAVSVSVVGDIDARAVKPEHLASLAPECPRLLESVAGAIASSGIYGGRIERCLKAVHDRTDFLTSLGAPFHNDIVGHWPSCLFWVLALDVVDVEFVMPALGLRHTLRPGDLLVFDPCLPHGLCRPRDSGVSVPFEDEAPGRHQAFLSGELRLEPHEWLSLGCPWLDKGRASFHGSVDLMLADIHPSTGVATNK